MEVLRRSISLPVDVKKEEEVTSPDWMALYTKKPTGNKSLFELEAIIAKRMELLAWIDQIVNSPKAESFESILKEIGFRLPDESRSRPSSITQGTILGSDALITSSMRSEGFRPSVNFSFEKEEDLLSHLLCRFAFCMSERWRKWFVKNEEILLRARLRLAVEKDATRIFLIDMMRKNNFSCEPLNDLMKADPCFIEYLEYRRKGVNAQLENPNNFYMVPLSLATRLIKSRSVLVRKGKAILYRDQVQEVVLTVFRGIVNKGLHTAYLSRIKEQKLTEESEKLNVIHMLDNFLEHFVAAPTDNLEEGESGTVRAGDISYLARSHFPLCMRQIDSHLRRVGHLKHTGRFTYGLFLKSIGLSFEDSLQLFSTLMTVKGGGSPESFAKTSYGYNIRHNYGMEGKKVSYSSASCATIMGLPPVVDQNDCHGCPFRFRDESRLRSTLQLPQTDPRGTSFGDVTPSLGEIEDIVNDCKGQHFTRACFKYFMATHKNIKRDALFRSPYEYYVASREFEAEQEEIIGKKRSQNTPGSSPDATKKRLE